MDKEKDLVVENKSCWRLIVILFFGVHFYGPLKAFAGTGEELKGTVNDIANADTETEFLGLEGEDPGIDIDAPIKSKSHVNSTSPKPDGAGENQLQTPIVSSSPNLAPNESENGSQVEPKVEVEKGELQSKPFWSGKKAEKGFKSEDDEGNYYYETSNDSSEKFYENDTVVQPDPKNKERGLLSVTSDGSYLYKPEESENTGSASLRVAQLSALPLERVINGATVSFKDMYGENPMPLVLFDIDLFRGSFLGHWALTCGGGYASATGKGYFLATAERAREVYTFHFLLAHLSATYRLQYGSHPWIAPYLSGGVMPSLIYERRDDNKRNHYLTSAAVHATGGLRFNLGLLDTYGVANLDAEYGINNLWLDLEMRRLQALDRSKIDISSNLVNVGLGFDF